MGMGREDENKERGNWSGRFDFILSCVGYAVGLGNVWRFPFLAYKNGGGAFYIPYWVMLIFVGMPILNLEFNLGQFSSLSSARCWVFARLFTGIGLAQAIVSFLVAIYYNMIIAWASFYLFASFSALPGLPWETCDADWATEWCMLKLNLSSMTTSECTAIYGLADPNGVCYNHNVTTNITSGPAGFWDLKLAKTNGHRPVVPTEDYLNNYVLHKSSGMDETGYPEWKLVLALLFAWIIVFLCMVKGIKSSGKVVYFTATFPYVILLILMIRGLMLDNMIEGIKFYIIPDVSRLGDIQVWRDAAVQLFFSLGASWGGLITLASYNRFHNDTLRDTFIVAIADTLTSMFAGIVIFCYIGFLSGELGIEIESVFAGGTTLAFQVFPYAVSLMPIAPLWSILFFFMLIILGLDSQFVLVETVLSSVLDTWPRQLRRRKTLVLIVMCVILFLLGLTLTTPGGVYWLDLLDTYSGGWNLMFVGLMECIAVCYVYGFRRFRADVKCMLGETSCCCIPWDCCSWWWAPMWGFFTPVGIILLMVYTWIKWERNPAWPLWAEVLGWLMLMGVVLSIFVIGFIMFITAPGGCGEKWRYVTQPTREWGPALVEHRRLVDYAPGFEVDPWGAPGQSGYEFDKQGDGYGNEGYKQ